MKGPYRLFVPGRLEVFGKHTDYAGGRSLVAAVGRGITVAATSTDDGRVVVRDLDGQEQAEFSADGTGPSDGWRCYPHTVIRRLAGNFPDCNLSARIELSSDLPQAAGISSSSALVIAVAEALIACSVMEETDAWRRAIVTVEDRAAYFGCIENGASFRTLAGDDGVGTHGGSEDHAAIVMSRAGHLQQFSFSPLRLDRAVRMPEGWTFAIASTGIAARKTGAARGAYNRLVASAATVQHGSTLSTVQHGSTPATVQHGSTLSTVQHSATLNELKLPAHLRARLDHFIAEDGRVPEATVAFERGDIARIGELAAASQRDAERLLGNQVPETIDMVRLAREAGAAAASGFGAGWGGSVWALIPAADADAFLAEWLRVYRARYPGLPSVGFVSAPGPGVTRL